MSRKESSRLNFNYLKGTKLKAEINTDEIWEGRLYLVTELHVVFKDATELKSNFFKSGLKYFVKNEFYSLNVVPDPDNPTVVADVQEVNFSDFKMWSDSCQNYKIINKCDDEFNNAIKEINKYRVIAVFGKF